ncbi:MAG: MerR family transcriptional regulator [Hyphomicrobiales bacterium]|nr:MerR family transcriptional regulator [Hyphomicrobiales bacterium]MBV8440540.1 MerR family transcriptional regulator [Hyphomicrobiales bacterium]
MEKSPEAFRTIREVADAMALPQHVLRFWETRFPQIRPLKRAGGRRYYRPDDVERLRVIKRLLYDEGYTIKGVQKLFKEQGTQALTIGAFDMRPAFDAAASGEFTFSAEQDPVPAPGAAAEGVGRQAATTPGRGGPSAPQLTAEDLEALHDCLEHIRRAERILTQARSPQA